METSVLEALLEELVDIPLHENEEHDERQDIFDVQAQPLREHEALAGVRFGDEVVPSPAALVTAEEQEHHRAEGQQVVADDEVFQIEDHGAGAEGLDAGQHVEAEGAGQGEQEDQNEVDGDRLLAGPFEHVDAVGYDVFQHGDDRGEGREAHEDEEEHAPQLSAGHAVEHVGKGDEHEAGTGARIDVEGETGREDDEAMSATNVSSSKMWMDSPVRERCLSM